MESLRPVVFRFGDAEFEQLEGRLRVAGHDRRLRPQTAAVLAQLLEHAGQLVTHDKLIEAVWGDTVVTDNSLAQCISEIRSALGAGQESLIDTVPRRGYVVRAVVTRELAGARGASAGQSASSSSVAEPSIPQVLAVSSTRTSPATVTSRRWKPSAAGVLAIVAAAIGWLVFLHFSRPEPPRLSLAVLPFQGRTAGTEQAWFGENVGEDIATNLSRIPGSHVIARVSTQAYANAGTNVRQVGRELGVRYVVGGNVERDGDRVGMTLYLADTDTGTIRWTERFDTTVADVGKAARQVADRVANTLHVTLVAAEAQRIEDAHARNPAADELALEAWAAWNRGSTADVARAKELAQRALALDERSVLAWKTMASWHLRARISQSIPAEQAVAGAEAAARRAMDIDPNHTLVHTVYGAAKALRGQYEQAQTALEHEIATNPSHPVAYYYLGLSHLMRGQPEQAVVQYQRAMAISPRDPRLSRFHRYLSLAYLHNHDLTSALRHAKAATQAPMVDRTAWATLASECALAGDAPCVAAAVAKLNQLWPGFTVAQGEAEWPPARPEFTARHQDYLKGLKLAGFADGTP
jgi:TolB-like protein/DNA-binding winged helix-turn-helix (wHTH) protein/Tfp pilus assembly protein PilF